MFPSGPIALAVMAWVRFPATEGLNLSAGSRPGWVVSGREFVCKTCETPNWDQLKNYIISNDYSQQIVSFTGPTGPIPLNSTQSSICFRNTPLTRHCTSLHFIPCLNWTILSYWTLNYEFWIMNPFMWIVLGKQLSTFLTECSFNQYFKVKFNL